MLPPEEASRAPRGTLAGTWFERPANAHSSRVPRPRFGLGALVGGSIAALGALGVLLTVGIAAVFALKDGIGASPEPATPAAPPAGPSTPAGAIDRALVVGEPVTILAVHPEDAFYNDRDAIVGKTCYPTDAMTLYDGGWHGGPLACWDGATYYFYKAAMGADPSHVPVDPAMLGGGVDVIQHGTRVKILDVSPEDAFYDDRKKLVGKSCQVDGDLHQQDMAGIWYGGGVLCKKDSYYFYKVSVEVKP